jgi:hypothetical protein
MVANLGGATATSAAVMVISLTCMLASSALAADCVVRGEQVDVSDIRVRVRGEQDLQVRLSGLAVVAKMSPDGNALLEVNKPISFRGVASQVPYSVRAPVDAENGLVRLWPGARLARAMAAGGFVEATVAMDPGEDWPDDREGADEWIQPVRLPCATLSLDVVGEAHSAGEAVDQGTSESVPVTWHPRHNATSVKLFAAARSDAPLVTLATTRCKGHCLPLSQIEDRGPWVRVARMGDRARVVGWVPRSELERTEGPHDALTTRDPSDSGRNAAAVVRRRGGSSEKVYEGPATVNIGTAVYARRGLGRWATVRKSGPFEVRWVTGQKWARLVSMPGISVTSGAAWVPAAALSLPRDKPR